MHKVYMHTGAIRQLLYGCAYVWEIIHSLKLVDYPPIHTYKPYNNLHLILLYINNLVDTIIAYSLKCLTCAQFCRLLISDYIIVS